MRSANYLNRWFLLLRCSLMVVIASGLFTLLLFSTLRVDAASIVVDEGCSLGDAIDSANADSSMGGCTPGSGADTIVLSNTTYVYTSAIPGGYTAVPYIMSNVTISGNGATIQRDLSLTCPISPTSKMFSFFAVPMTGTLTLDDVTLQNGCMEVGGAVVSNGQLTILNSRIMSSTSAIGGGIYSSAGVITVTNSSFISNTGVLYGGGLVFSEGLVENSEFTLNHANSSGGAIAFGGPNRKYLLSNRIYENSTDGRGSALYVTSGVARMDNNLIAANEFSSPALASDIAFGDSGSPSTLSGEHNTFVAADIAGSTAISAGLEIAGDQVFLTDTIISGYDRGLVASGNGTRIVANGLLWENTELPTQTMNSAQITVTNAFSGSAAFANVAAHDYRLTLASDAINRGVSNLPATDFEGDARPYDVISDLGFDELTPLAAITISKTVGTDADNCASTDLLTVDADTAVYYCFTLFNHGDITLTDHTLVDTLLGVQTPLAFTLAPSASVQITRSLISELGPFTVTEAVTNTVFVTSTNESELPKSSALDATVLLATATGTDSAVVRVNPDEPPVGDDNLYMPVLRR